MDIAFRRFHFRPQDTRLYRLITRNRARRGQRESGAGPGGAKAGSGTENEEEGSGIRSKAAGPVNGGASVPGGTTGIINGEADITGEPAGTGSKGRDGIGRETEDMEARSGKNRKRAGKLAGEQKPQSLDTSALLKKKDQRNHS